MLQSLKHSITNNWALKVVSLVLATMLWMAVANQASSEIGLDVPLEYRNIPPQLEITGDMTNSVQVRLRGSSHVIKGLTAKDVPTTIDLSKMRTGEKIAALSPLNVQAPFGAEVIRVNPSSVRFSLERTLVKTVPIVPTIIGQPPDEFEIATVAFHGFHVVFDRIDVEVIGAAGGMERIQKSDRSSHLNKPDREVASDETEAARD